MNMSLAMALSFFFDAGLRSGFFFYGPVCSFSTKNRAARRAELAAAR
jgi:hypothetical protein